MVPPKSTSRTPGGVVVGGRSQQDAAVLPVSDGASGGPPQHFAGEGIAAHDRDGASEQGDR
ncbi:hypothetical protein GCM10009816_18830 [Microbacterium aquimaris]